MVVEAVAVYAAVLNDILDGYLVYGTLVQQLYQRLFNCFLCQIRHSYTFFPHYTNIVP